MSFSQPINFTKPTLQALICSENKTREYFKDAIVKGLVLDVRRSGSKSFYLCKKIKGKTERIYIGSFPDLTIENARKIAQVKLGEIALGKNPQDEKRKIRSELTLGELFQEYMNRHSKRHKKSWVYDEREIPKYLSRWFNRKISDIEKFEVKRLHEDIFVTNGLYQANRILERIRGMYNKAIDWGWEGGNPAKGIKKYKEKKRERFIQPGEMPCLLRSLDEEPSQAARDYFRILLLTGARKTNTLMMRFADINWDQAQWLIPDTKNGDSLLLPLVSEVMEILKRRRRESNSNWVFPSEQDNEKYLVNVKRPWKRLLQKATIYWWAQDAIYASLVEDTGLIGNSYIEVENSYNALLKMAEKRKIQLPVGLMDIRLHDVRRTFGSYQAITGASLQIIGKSLGHKSLQATEIYARLNLDPVRASIEKAVSAMLVSSH